MLEWADALRAVRERQHAGVALAGVTEDSRRLRPGMVFVARRGEHVDGHAFLADARARGAALTIGERDADVVVADPATALAALVSAWNGDPGARLNLVGITGTNGKSTVTHLVAAILRAGGARPGLVGTTGYAFGGPLSHGPHTTPPPEVLYPLLRRWVDAGADSAVLEVSAQGLAQGRTAALRFSAAALTSFSREHGEAFPNHAAYLAAKARLFREETEGIAVLPHAEARHPDWADAVRGLRVLTFGRGGFVRATAQAGPGFGPALVELRWPGYRLRFPYHLPGAHNLRNASCAAALALGLGLPGEAIASGLQSVRGVPGRGVVLAERRGSTVIVDYAHNPAALRAVLTMARAGATGRLHVVLGPRGERDPGKRPRMGAVIAALADSAVITADRPASEDPTRAARSMLAAARARGLDAVFVRDRAEAIALAASRLAPGDALVVTGKGVEPWGGDDSTSGFHTDVEALGAVLDLGGGAEPALAEA